MISKYSFAGRETAGTGSAMISDIITSPGSALISVNSTLIPFLQFADLSHKRFIINLFKVLLLNLLLKVSLNDLALVLAIPAGELLLPASEKFERSMKSSDGSSSSVRLRELIPDTWQLTTSGGRLSSWNTPSIFRSSNHRSLSHVEVYL